MSERVEGDVIFAVENEDVRASKQLLISKSQYFQEILSGSESYSEVRVLMPE